jgi:hypothetical protein
MTKRKELVKQAIRFQGPQRIPLSNPYDLKSSDIVGLGAKRENVDYMLDAFQTLYTPNGK